jgi:hypothetical protein
MDILGRLRSSEAPSLQKFSIYIPNKRKNREDIDDIGDWVDAAAHILTEINGGSTQQAVAKGSWKSHDGEIMLDDVVVVYSFIRYPDAFEGRFSEISSFLHHFGTECEQESVLVELTEGHRAYFLNEEDYAVA